MYSFPYASIHHTCEVLLVPIRVHSWFHQYVSGIFVSSVSLVSTRKIHTIYVESHTPSPPKAVLPLTQRKSAECPEWQAWAKQVPSAKSVESAWDKNNLLNNLTTDETVSSVPSVVYKKIPIIRGDRSTIFSTPSSPCGGTSPDSEEECRMRRMASTRGAIALCEIRGICVRPKHLRERYMWYTRYVET